MDPADENDISRLLHRLREVTDDMTRFAKNARVTQSTGAQGGCPTQAASLLRQRKARKRYLPGDLFREPGWDLLLTVYIADCDGHPTNVKALVLMVDSPPATAQRWIDHLDRLGLILRTTDPLDRRRVEVSMTDTGRKALEAYLTAMPAM